MNYADAVDPDDDDPTPISRRRDRTRTRRDLSDLSDLTGPYPGTSDGEDARAGAPGPYSTWGDAQHGPQPRPHWVVTTLGAIDTELGVLKTGKEADVHLIERQDAARGARCLMAAKRFRSSEHRMFHRDAGYLDGRRVRRSRETRAMARRTEFGRDLIGMQWANAEFEALSALWSLTRPGDSPSTHRALVPYPVQLRGRELLMEFIGEDDGTAAPRLAETRPDGEQLVDLWHQATAALGTLALAGLAHADLSAYNVLVHRGRLVLIDLPQVVDIVANPQGPQYLARDVANLSRWFLARGLPEELCDAPRLVADLAADAGIHPAGQ